MKKGLAKKWITILGGVFITVVILIAFVFFASNVASAIEDSSNFQAFNDYKNLMAKSMSQGEHSLSPFEMRASIDDRYYAIAFISRKTANCWYSNDRTATGPCEPYNIEQPYSHDNRRVVEKCIGIGTNVQNSLNPMDQCLCLIRVQYEKGCDDGRWHFITSASGGSVQGDFSEMSDWSNNKLLPAFDKGAVKELKVIECSRIMSDIGCIYEKEDGSKYPCVPYFKDKPVVWIGAFGGFVFNKPLELEKMDMSRDEWRLRIEPYEKGREGSGEWDKGIHSNIEPCGDCFACSD